MRETDSVEMGRGVESKIKARLIWEIWGEVSPREKKREKKKV